MKEDLITNKNNTRSILNVVVGVWLALSTIGILWMNWNDFKENKLEPVYRDAYKNAQETTMKAVMDESKKCQPFQVFVGQERVELVNTSCDGVSVVRKQ